MAANQKNTSIPSSRNTEYFAVVDKLYEPKDGEKVFDICGKRILVKNPEALENFKDMVAFWHRFAEKVYFPIENLLYQDPSSIIVNYRCDLINLIIEIDQNVYDKMRHRPAKKDIDFSFITFDSVYEMVFGFNAQQDFQYAFDEYDKDLKAYGSKSEEIKESIMLMMYRMASYFQRIVAVYTSCLNAYGYNIFTPYKIHKKNSMIPLRIRLRNCSLPSGAPIHLIRVWMTR